MARKSSDILSAITTMSPPTLLTLPRELRDEIYSHLTTPEPTSYPFTFSSPITSISHRPPPSTLQRTCHFLYTEVLSYFYALATLRFVQRAFKSTHDEGISYGRSLECIRCARKVEIVLVWDLKKEPVTWDKEEWPWGLNGFLEDLVRLLVEEGKSLDVVMVSVRDTCAEEVGLNVRERMLAPLESLIGRVKLVTGDVSARSCQEDALRDWLGKYVGKWNHTMT